MTKSEIFVKQIDKVLVEKNKNYMTLGQANKLLFEKDLISESEKKNQYLKKLLESGEIKNASQTERSPRQWRIFLSDKNLKKKNQPLKKSKKETYEKKTFSNQQIQTNNLNQMQNNNNWKWILGAIVALIFIIGQFSDDDYETGDSDSILAYNYAQDFIKEQLKSPSTAKFPGTFEKKDHVRPLGNGQYQINSWVDSQNGFGAMIRSRWSCKIIFKNDQVQAENIRIE